MSPAPSRPRTRFGLDTVLPADPLIVEAHVLRRLGEIAPAVLAVRPSPAPDRPQPPGHRAVPRLPKGAPDLVLLGPGGRTACLKIGTQAARLTRSEAAFRDLCRQQAIPFAVVRSAAEAEAALHRFGFVAEAAPAGGCA